jgi:hypothetical protein
MGIPELWLLPCRSSFVVQKACRLDNGLLGLAGEGMLAGAGYLQKQLGKSGVRMKE